MRYPVYIDQEIADALPHVALKQATQQINGWAWKRGIHRSAVQLVETVPNCLDGRATRYLFEMPDEPTPGLFPRNSDGSPAAS